MSRLSVQHLMMVNSTEEQLLALLTDLEDPGDCALVQKPHTLAVGGVLILQGKAAPSITGTAVHPDVALIPGEGPEHQPLLYRLWDAREALLNPLEWHSSGHQLGGDIQERAGVVFPEQRV